jgi:hypothetical protein
MFYHKEEYMKKVNTYLCEELIFKPDYYRN